MFVVTLFSLGRYLLIQNMQKKDIVTDFVRNDIEVLSSLPSILFGLSFS